eukprot:6091515-Pyramimonas_sp.AAC.1
MFRDHCSRRWARWRSWAQEAVTKGGKAAHAFSKERPPAVGPLSPHGWALQGDQAVEDLRKEWSQYWCCHQCPLTAQHHRRADEAPPLFLGQKLKC